MNKLALGHILAVFALLVAGGAAAAAPPETKGWPAHVFAPYMYVGAGDQFKLTACDDACGLKYYTLAFIIAGQQQVDGDIKYLKDPCWDGRIPMGQNFYQEQISAIRKRGGDVIISFGGEAGREIAIVETNPAALQADYQSIIDRYHFTWLDFDIEGKNLTEHPEANRRRNSVLALLQKKNPGLIVSYTLPVNPDGISDASKGLLFDAKSKGLAVHSVDLMIMFFGREFIHKGKSEGQLGIDSAKAAYAQIHQIDPAVQIGLCPCLGANGSGDEIFTLSDARQVRGFADQTPWVCSLGFWSINNDAGRASLPPDARPAMRRAMPAVPWSFTKIFEGFTSR